MNKFLSTTVNVLTLATLCAPAFALNPPVPASSTTPVPAVKTNAPVKLIKGQKINKNKSMCLNKKAKSIKTEKALGAR